MRELRDGDPSRGAGLCANVAAPTRAMRPAAPVVGLDPPSTGCKIAAAQPRARPAAPVVHPRRRMCDAPAAGMPAEVPEFCERHGARAVAVGDGGRARLSEW